MEFWFSGVTDATILLKHNILVIRPGLEVFLFEGRGRRALINEPKASKVGVCLNVVIYQWVHSAFCIGWLSLEL